MWYDTIRQIPKRGSLMETVLMMVSLKRQQASLLATRAIVQSTLPEGKAANAAIKAFQVYYDAQMPFMDRAANSEFEQAKANLMQMVKHPLRFSLTPHYQAEMAKAVRLSKRQRFALRARSR